MMPKDMEQEPRYETRGDAAKAGRTIWLRQRPCQVCGLHEFYTSSNQCVACTKERAKRHCESVRQIYRDAKGI